MLDYPLPPGEEKTEILRIVVRESMTLNLLDRLINDIIVVTEGVMKSEDIDLSAWQPFTKVSLEKQHASLGVTQQDKHKAKRPMADGVSDDTFGMIWIEVLISSRFIGAFARVM